MSRDGEPRGGRRPRGRPQRPEDGRAGEPRGRAEDDRAARADRQERRPARGARSPIWSERAPGSRRPSVSREQIADQALAIADAEGLDAVSMRRVAAELGVGTMTLYHYVRTKDDLWSLMGDRIMGELLVPDAELPLDDWRTAITAIARNSKGVFDRHPWVFTAMEGGRMGPNGLRHFEQSLAAVASTGADAASRLEIIALVDDFVFGYALRRAQDQQERIDEVWMQAAEAYVTEQLETGEYPYLEALLGDGDRRATWDRLAELAHGSDRFEHGLEAMLDGIERRFVDRP